MRWLWKHNATENAAQTGFVSGLAACGDTPATRCAAPSLTRRQTGDTLKGMRKSMSNDETTTHRCLRGHEVPIWLRLARIYQKIERANTEQLRRFGLSHAQFDVLAHVGAVE